MQVCFPPPPVPPFPLSHLPTATASRKAPLLYPSPLLARLEKDRKKGHPRRLATAQSKPTLIQQSITASCFSSWPCYRPPGPGCRLPWTASPPSPAGGPRRSCRAARSPRPSRCWASAGRRRRRPRMSRRGRPRWERPRPRPHPRLCCRRPCRARMPRAGPSRPWRRRSRTVA